MKAAILFFVLKFCSMLSNAYGKISMDGLMNELIDG